MDTTILHADELNADLRIQQARELIQQALSDHREKLTGPRPPREELKAGYAELLKEFAVARGGALFFPYLGSGLGNGALVELADGSVKFDMISGIGVHGWGHSDPGLTDAVVKSAICDTVMQGNLQQDRHSVELSRAFIHLAGGRLKHCFLTTSGATANENALKLLFQKRHPAGRMLAFSNCFAGRTLATSQLTDRAKNRIGLPTVLPVDYIPYFDEQSSHESLGKTLAALREHVQRYPGMHAGMVLELIQGEGGYYCAPPEFLRTVCHALREEKIPIWFDEIQTFGRTSRPFAFQHFGLEEFADVVTVGKLTQVCATIFSDEFVPGPGLVSQTFTGASSSIEAARHILRELEAGDWFGEQGRLMQIHARFVQRFEALHQRTPTFISGPWGIGGMVAFTALDGSDTSCRRFLNALFEAGVIAFSAGGNPARVRMLPPFGAITDEQIDQVCDLIEQTLLECSRS